VKCTIRRSDVSAGRHILHGKIVRLSAESRRASFEDASGRLENLVDFYGGKPIANFTAEYSG
jgi:hypothetical protein